MSISINAIDRILKSLSPWNKKYGYYLFIEYFLMGKEKWRGGEGRGGGLREDEDEEEVIRVVTFKHINEL